MKGTFWGGQLFFKKKTVCQPKHFPDPYVAIKRQFLTVTEHEYVGRKGVMYYCQVQRFKARGYNPEYKDKSRFHVSLPLLKTCFRYILYKKKDLQKNVHLQTKEPRQYARIIYSHSSSYSSVLFLEVMHRR